MRDLDQAERWYQHSLDHRAEHDRIGQAKSLWGLGNVAFERFLEAREADAPEVGAPGPPQRSPAQSTSRPLTWSRRTIPKTSPASTTSSALIYRQAGDTRQALHHYQQSIQYKEARGDVYGAGQTRYNIALLLVGDGRPGDALHYARAALHDYDRTGPGAAQKAARARELIALLEQQVAEAT